MFPRYEVAVTDFGRDLAGAQAAILGINPYQQLGTLEPLLPGLVVPEEAETYWVAHSPLSIAAARLAFHVAGYDALEVARFAVALTSLVLIGWILFALRGRNETWKRMIMAGAVAMSLGVETDYLWVQGAAILALLLAAVVQLNRTGKNLLAFCLFGLIVAWRPWCAPIALFLPHERKLKALVIAAFTATSATAASLPFVGGLDAVTAWFTDALPDNVDLYLRFDWNISLIGPYFGVLIAVTLFALFAIISNRRNFGDSWNIRLGALATLGLLPIVWHHYWTALSPLLIGSRRSDYLVTAFAYLLMATPMIGGSSLAARVGAGVGLAILAFHLFVDRFPSARRSHTPILE
jgi:hypothetical protein